MENDTKKETADLAKIGSHTDVANGDDYRLAQLGHAQELKRQFSLPALGALCLCLMATWEALSTVIAPALLSGGAPCLFYNLIISTICTVCIASSLAEIASIYPTAGGQYHWVAALCPPSTRSAAAFATGWISVGGQVVLTSSAAFAAGLQTQALIIINDDSYISARWQGMLFYWAILVYGMAMNIWGHRLLPTANLMSGVLHVVGFVAILIVLGVMAPKNTASFVFTEFVNSSGWDSDGVSWLVGLISAVYPFLGYDAACHLAEEMPNASRDVPLAMVGSVVVNGLMGLIYGTVLLFCTGPLETLLSTPTGFPFMQIFIDVTKSRAGATILSILIILTAVAATVAGITSTSRTLWAFARDKATPYDHYLSKVNKRQQIPIHSVILVTVLQMLLGFIYLGNTTAFNAILSMAIIGMYSSYIIPIAYMMAYGRKNLNASDYGPFKLGPILGPILNVVSLVWMVVVIIFSTFPSAMPVTPQTMNYSVVVMAGWLFFGVVYYLSFGKKKFKVPSVDGNVVTGISIPMDVGV
ncbi:choline transport protein (amino acid permease) [Colletotrichum tofieldiae]|uniref:Choline transport protein (Amino acid permease) n=1 Tax=Colletotrichum tofieldiae TaxID=708197 RepID=A0A166Z0R2_9PEZI|nr:choline transport protein (amino acid permease) [Colletotrichum tofieldiae]GKT86406.1 choline transport protein [Colletotrichum tofieldiae]